MLWSPRLNGAAIMYTIILSLLFPRGYSAPNCQSLPFAPRLASLPRRRSRECRQDRLLPDRKMAHAFFGDNPHAFPNAVARVNGYELPWSLSHLREFPWRD